MNSFLHSRHKHHDLLAVELSHERVVGYQMVGFEKVTLIS